MIEKGTRRPFPMITADSTTARYILVKQGSDYQGQSTVTIPTATTDKIIGVTHTDAAVQYYPIDIVGPGDITKIQVETGATVTGGDLVRNGATDYQKIRTLTYTAVTGTTNCTLVGQVQGTATYTAGKFAPVMLYLLPVTV